VGVVASSSSAVSPDPDENPRLSLPNRRRNSAAVTRAAATRHDPSSASGGADERRHERGHAKEGVAGGKCTPTDPLKKPLANMALSWRSPARLRRGY
jgi:hypothetical protein